MATIYIKKETIYFFYLRIQYGDLEGWGSKKTFVRIPYKKKNGEMGSKYYCTSKYDAILFDHPAQAAAFAKTFKADYDIAFMKLPDNALLEEVNIEGIRCYKCKNVFAGRISRSLGINL